MAIAVTVNPSNPQYTQYLSTLFAFSAITTDDTNFVVHNSVNVTLAVFSGTLEAICTLATPIPVELVFLGATGGVKVHDTTTVNGVLVATALAVPGNYNVPDTDTTAWGGAVLDLAGRA